MSEQTSSARIYEKTLIEYRMWANTTGRNLTDMLEIALRFGLRKQSAVEREISNELKAQK
jgi:hypothetical protein